MIDRAAKILIVGDNDHIEQGFYRKLVDEKFTNVFSSSLIGLDASIQSAVYAFFQKERPDYVILGSTRSGGIGANQAMPADFIYHNCESQNNVIYSSWKWKVKKLVYLSASCVYPKQAPNPIKEETLLTGELEETAAPYSVAKIAGIKMCEAFRKQYKLDTVSVVPATIYGPQRDIDAANSHVMGALIKNIKDAIDKNQNEIKIWGTGTARREFVYIDDFVRAVMMLLDRPTEHSLINVGTGSDVSILELAKMIAQASGFKGEIKCDASKPDGAKNKLLDSSRIQAFGWAPKVSLPDGIAQCVEYLKEKV